MKKKIYKAITVAVAIMAFTVLILFLLLEKTAALIASVVAVIILCPFFAWAFSQKISDGVKNTDIDDPDADDCDEELKPLLRKIVRQEALISRQASQLRKRQREFNAITENMAEGLIVSDKKGEIILANSRAREMLLDGSDGTSVWDFSGEEGFLEPVRCALRGKVSQGGIRLPGKIYKVYANPLISENKPAGAVIMVLDKTEEELRETMRREFTSNVSHELKTPLTSIYGISEILAGGIVRKEDIPKFAKSIYDEAGRLITLVNDIIKLSQMDENSVMEQREWVDMPEITAEAMLRLNDVAAKKDITLKTTGDSGKVFGIKSILSEMIYNLMDNGIKYNRQGGEVCASVEDLGDNVVITVADTGIGISNEHIGRIFERFYRVDKSHSRHVGGTGLGLSIVKHGASFHNARIEVKSTLNKGTEIKLTFPLHKDDLSQSS